MRITSIGHLKEDHPALLLRAVSIVTTIVLFSGCTAPEPASWLGLNTQIGYPATVPASATTHPADDFEFVRELKVPIIRDTIMNWWQIESEPDGKFDFSLSDDVVRRAQATRTELLVVFSGIPSWAAATPVAGPVSTGVPSRDQCRSFTRFVRAFVSRYRLGGKFGNTVRAYEFLQNIEDIPAAEYAYWLKLFHNTVKQTCSGAMVVMGSLRSPGIKMADRPEGNYHTYLERLLAETELQGIGHPFFDVLAFQNFPRLYPGRKPFDEAYAYLHKTLEDQKLGLPIWLTAFGSEGDVLQENHQADEVVKWSLHARALGIERVYWYGLHDRSMPGTASGEALGLLRETEPAGPPTRKPSFLAMHYLLGEIKKRPNVTFKNNGVYMLSGEGEPTFVVWNPEPNQPPPPLTSGWWEARSITGERLARQGTMIKLTGRPMFMRRIVSPIIQP